MNEKVLNLLGNETFLKELSTKETPVEVMALFADNGVTLTEEEVLKMRDIITKSASGELNEDDLENVAGGSAFTDAMGKVDDWFKEAGRQLRRW